jgi:hypothetical protein
MAVVVLPEPIIPSIKISCAVPTSQGYDAVFRAPGGMTGQGQEACVQFYASWSGTHQGVLHNPAGDIPPTGRTVALHYIHVPRYRDGLHISFNLMFDRLLMLEQLGLIPAPASTG